MADKELDSIEPRVLNESLPPKLYGVEEWGFVLKTGQVTFVEVINFDYPPAVYLKTPVMLGVRLTSDGEQQATPEHEGLFVIEDIQESVLCSARWRQVGGVWDATFHNAQRQIGKANGTLGASTSPQFLEAALIAMVRHSTAKHPAKW